MDRAAPDQPDRPYRGRRGGANRRVQVFYNAQDLASGAIRRLVRIQGETPNFIIPRRQYDQNDPYVALIVNVDWYGVQTLLADEVTRLAPYIPGLDAQIQAARRAAAQGAADGAPEPEQELNPADPAVRSTEDRQQQNLDDYTDVEVDYTDVEVEPELLPYPRRLVLRNRSRRKKGKRPNKTRWRRRRQQGTQLLPRRNQRKRRRRSSPISCLRLRVQPAAHQSSSHLPLVEVELPLEGNEQDLDQVQASPPEPPLTEGDGAAVASEAEVDGEVGPVAVQEEGAESEHPLAYHPISSVLARPTILRAAVTGYPTLRIDRTGIWQLVAAEQSESAAARALWC